MEWIQWVFSGIGVVAITGIIGLLSKKNKSNPNQTITSGNNSRNYQSGNSLIVKDDSNERK